MIPLIDDDSVSAFHSSTIIILVQWAISNCHNDALQNGLPKKLSILRDEAIVEFVSFQINYHGGVCSQACRHGC
jgi:hypothetical protein